MIDTKKLAKELNGLEEGGIILIETTAEKLLGVHLAAVKWLSKKNYAQIILATSRPCTTLRALYKKNNIDMGKITVLCACCQENEKTKQAWAIHVSGSSSLTEMSLLLSNWTGSITGKEFILDKKFVFVDSINTLLIHNDPHTLARFIHSMLTKMRMSNVSGLLNSLDGDTDKEVRAEIAQLCDKIISI